MAAVGRLVMVGPVVEVVPIVSSLLGARELRIRDTTVVLEQPVMLLRLAVGVLGRLAGITLLVVLLVAAVQASHLLLLERALPVRQVALGQAVETQLLVLPIPEMGQLDATALQRSVHLVARV